MRRPPYRGFLLIRDTSYLDPYRSATELVQQHIGLLSALVHDPDQRQRVDSLDFLEAGTVRNDPIHPGQRTQDKVGHRQERS
jgi:hypothetical protein